MYPRSVRAFGLLSFALVGCVVPDVGIEGKPCPCPDGYACDEVTSTCVQGSLTASGGGGNGASGPTSTTGTGPCQGLCGTDGCSPCPEVAIIDAGGFGIDATEVTRGAYQAFLADAVDPSTQGPLCTWNQDLAPVEGEEYCEDAYDFSNPLLPITCVDWCDAAAYCKWAGKRLCGRIGGPATLLEDEVDDPTKSAWYAACSLGGTRAYPYGDTYDAGFCNVSGGPGSGDVGMCGTYLQCEGGTAGLFDMIGNAEEWEDACSQGPDPSTDNCYIRGGAFHFDELHSRCLSNADRVPDRNFAANDRSFRCCTDF